MHPLRKRLHDELHARPSIYFDGPAIIYHLAILDDGNSANNIIETLSSHCEPSTSNISTRHQLMRINGLPFKWEWHTEFLTMTLVVPRIDAFSGWTSAPKFLEEIITQNRSLVINATQILVEDAATWLGTPQSYGFKDPASSNINNGDASIWSDFRLDSNGFNHILLVNNNLNAFRLGRSIRRLLEIETYRMLASLTLPLAQELSVELQTFERNLATLAQKNSSICNGSARLLLDEITLLSAELANRTAKTRQRFSATEAYSLIVFERVSELRENSIKGYQQVGKFIERRFRPGVRYCEATEKRLERITSSVANLGDLLQARVQVEVEEQNSKILAALDLRAMTQIRIQKAVEGFSIIAISYYLISVLKIICETLSSLGVSIAPRIVVSLLIPLVIGMVVLIAKRLKRAAI